MKINNLKESVLNEINLLLEKIEFKVSKKQEDYARLTFSDGVAKIDAFLWNVDKSKFDLTAGKIYQVFGFKQNFNNRSNIKIMEINLLEDQSCIKDFIKSAPLTITEIKESIFNKIDNINDSELKEMTLSIVKQYEDKYFSAPAAANNHHAYFSGMSYHVFNMLNVLETFDTNKLNIDVLISAIVLHDIGKCFELESNGAITYTDSGKLLGHIAIGFEIVYEYLCENQIESENCLEVMDLILAHHGKIEYGNLKECTSNNEIAINLIDTIDAYINSFIENIEAIELGEWSENIYALNNRKVQKWDSSAFSEKEPESINIELQKFTNIYLSRYKNINSDIIQLAFLYIGQNFVDGYKRLLDVKSEFENKYAYRYLKHIILSATCVNDVKPILPKIIEGEIINWFIEIEKFNKSR